MVSEPGNYVRQNQTSQLSLYSALDYIKSCASIEVCRQVVVALDKEKTSIGRLGYPEFKDLIVSLKLWQSVFRTHSKEKTGVLRAERLRDALLEVGFRLSGEIMSILILRYMRKDGTLRFGDFVAIILNLTVAFCTYLHYLNLKYFLISLSISALFERKDSTRNGVVKINMSEVIKLSLFSLISKTLHFSGLDVHCLARTGTHFLELG